MVSAKSPISQNAVTVPVKVDSSVDMLTALAAVGAATHAKTSSHSRFATVGEPEASLQANTARLALVGFYSFRFFPSSGPLLLCLMTRLSLQAADRHRIRVLARQ